MNDKELLLFPTPVGVFPFLRRCSRPTESLPHARGGVSRHGRTRKGLCNSSPRPWGCFHPFRVHSAKSKLFPTPVGVFLPSDHTCSPACTLPYARGGVSAVDMSIPAKKPSSPRPWGCFHLAAFSTRPQYLFPTPMGVFPSIPPEILVSTALPHARGGVSSVPEVVDGVVFSSPRPWGCFWR